MSIFISILAVGLLIALHEAGHFLAARRVGMTVLKYSIGFFNSLVSWKSEKSGTVYQIGMVPLGGFVQIKGMNPFEEGAYDDASSYQTKSTFSRAKVLLAGPFANLGIAWIILFFLYMGGHPEYVDEPRVGSTVPGAPAEKAGIKPGDHVVTLNGEVLNTWGDLASRLHKHPDNEVTLEIQRNDDPIQVKVTPENKNGIGLIGIRQPEKMVYLAPHTAALAAAIRCAQVIGGTFSSLASLVGGDAKNVQPVGPVGIVKMAASSLNTGISEFFALVAYLSIMLFIFNLLPFPGLDGGRGVFLLYESVSRRRVSPKVDAVVNAIGFVLLVGLLVLITFKEIFLS